MPTCEILDTFPLGAIATGLSMAMIDPIVIAQVDTGNPWFRLIIGYSLPVLLAIGFAIIGIWIWARWQDKWNPAN